METKISVLLADPGEQYRAAYSKAIGQETQATHHLRSGIRRVMEVRDRIHGIHGVVADLITMVFLPVPVDASAGEKCIVARDRHLRDLQRSGADGVCGARHDVLYAKAV